MMSLKQFSQIMLAIVVSLTAGFVVREARPDDTCSLAALDAILDGGHLRLADDCVLIISSAAVITGKVTIEGGILHSSGVDRVLIVTADANLVLRNTAVLSGAAQIEPAYGGGIYNEGSLLLDNTRIAANSAQQGGGIYNEGRLFIINGSEIARNRAREGGGIYNLGFLIIEDSSIVANSVQSDDTYGGYGAGIANKGALGIVQSQIINNRGDTEGIGIDTSGTLAIRESVIMGNQCTVAACRGTGILRFEGTVDARYNYWGSPDGPGEDADGSGDGIIGVDEENYLPFLTEIPDWAR